MPKTIWPPLTEFQKAILWAVETSDTRSLSRWAIAQKAFPEKWARRQGRGALIGHIDRAAKKMPEFFHRLPPKQIHNDVLFALKRFRSKGE